MIDLHCHVLPGIDDGPDTIEDSIALVRAAHAGGTRTMVATSHVSWQYQNDSETIARLTHELNERLRQEQIDVEIRPGAEIAMTRAAELAPDELERLRLGSGPWVLLEPPFASIATGIDTVALGLQNAGHRVLLAHPERCPAFHRDPSTLEALVQEGVLTSITAGSLVGRFGSEVRRFTRRLLANDLVHNVASDAHNVGKRPPGITAELAEAGLEELSDWLAHDVPAAILNGDDIPPRPHVSASGTSRFARLRLRRR